MIPHTAAPDRYHTMPYRRCGQSGIQLPRISLGLWHNFGAGDQYATALAMVKYAFDRGVTHFDLANNYGPPPGSAETTFGRILREQLSAYRSEMIITTKAGHRMCDGPYGDGGSRKSIINSLDQSLMRMGIDYVDIFYSHRYDPDTPLEETLQALVDVVRAGKALYIGLSKYPPRPLARAISYLRAAHTPCLVYQDRYNLLTPQVEEAQFPLLQEAGIGFVAFSPLAQGLLTDKYLHGIPAGSRAARPEGFLQASQVTPEVISRVEKLNQIAKQYGYTLAQLALAWLLQHTQVTSVIVGASSLAQLQENIALPAQSLSPDQWRQIATLIA